MSVGRMSITDFFLSSHPIIHSLISCINHEASMHSQFLFPCHFDIVITADHGMKCRKITAVNFFLIPYVNIQDSAKFVRVYGPGKHEICVCACLYM